MRSGMSSHSKIQETSSRGSFNLPPHLINKIESRNKRRVKTAIHHVLSSNGTDTIQRIIDELIDRLCITQSYLSPTVLIDTIALLIRSYLVEELHIRLSQPLRHLTYSPFNQCNIAIFPPKSHGITHPLVLNDKEDGHKLLDFCSSFDGRYG